GIGYKRPRPRPPNEADHFGRRLLRSPRRGRRGAPLQPDGEPRPFPPRHRWVRLVRSGDLREAAPLAPPEGPARGGTARRRGADARLRTADRRRVPLRRLPVHDRRVRPRLPAQRRLLVLPAGGSGHADPPEPEANLGETLALSGPPRPRG